MSKWVGGKNGQSLGCHQKGLPSILNFRVLRKPKRSRTEIGIVERLWVKMFADEDGSRRSLNRKLHQRNSGNPVGRTGHWFSSHNGEMVGRCWAKVVIWLCQVWGRGCTWGVWGGLNRGIGSGWSSGLGYGWTVRRWVGWRAGGAEPREYITVPFRAETRTRQNSSLTCCPRWSHQANLKKAFFFFSILWWAWTLLYSTIVLVCI